MYYCFIFANFYQNNNQIWSGFPLISGQIPPTSGCSDWPDGDPHKGYTCSRVLNPYQVGFDTGRFLAHSVPYQPLTGVVPGKTIL